MKKLAIVLLILLPACEDPSFNIGASVSSGGVDVSPSVSGRMGGVGVAMPMKRAILLLALTVAACGADGPPEPVDTGVASTREARIGVAGTP